MAGTTTGTWALLIASLAALAGGAALAARTARRPRLPHQALGILDERLARGELSPAEHEQRRAVLGARTRIPRQGQAAAALIAVGLAGVVVAAVSLGPDGRRYRSNGQRIYLTGISDSGDPVDHVGGPGGFTRRRLACAQCHGRNGRGGHVGMMDSFSVPDIRWPTLTEAAHADEHADHAPYTEATLKRAITQGVDPAGQPLDRLMPRWRMSDGDLDDLVAYLQTLGATSD